MAEAIIVRKGGRGRADVSGVTAGPAQVRSGYYFVANNGALIQGTMANRGSLSRTVYAGNNYSYSSGYYTGGTISARETSSSATLHTDIITKNQTYFVPNHIGSLDVRVFGGGGGGGYRAGGGGGWMDNGNITLSNGASVHITIGSGGMAINGGQGTSGGTTSFGPYLSAAGGGGADQYGGDGGSGGGGSIRGGKGYQFGGGGSYDGKGGDGGPYGGGGGVWAVASGGGSGGTYGGGGGVSRNKYGIGGTYGGNGGNVTVNPENGTNTMSNSSVLSDCRGYGKAGNTNTGGGGGFGGNGGSRTGGGGGYGGNGGANGGGGGGYGKGADGGVLCGGGGGWFSSGGSYYGGGGGYGNGGDGTNSPGLGGGGGVEQCGAIGVCIIQYYA